jgi:hypothetical protein
MDNDMMEKKVDSDYISQTEAKKEYAVAVGVDQVEDWRATGETGVVGLGGNCGIGVRLARYRMGLRRLHYGDGFLWMVVVEIVGIGEEVEERGKSIDSLDVDRDWDCHRHDVEEASVGKRKALGLLADKHYGYS